jgi:hypothetical protein
VTGGESGSSGLVARTKRTRTAIDLGRRESKVFAVLAMAVLVLTPCILGRSAGMPKSCCRIASHTWLSTLLLFPFFAPEVLHDLHPYAPSRAFVDVQGVAEGAGDIRVRHIDKFQSLHDMFSRCPKLVGGCGKARSADERAKCGILSATDMV